MKNEAFEARASLVVELRAHAETGSMKTLQKLLLHRAANVIELLNASPPEGRQDGGVAVKVLLDFEPQIAFSHFGPERSIRWILEWFYKANDIPEAKAKHIVASYAAALEEVAASLTHSTHVEDTRWQKLRDLFGLDGWHDGHFNGIASPDQIVTHIEYVANERARLMFEATALAAQPLQKQGAGELELIREAYKKALYVPGDYPVLPQKAAAFMRTVGEILAAQPPETMQPDTYTGGNFNGVVE